MESTLFEEQVKTELKSMDQRLNDLEEKISSIDTKLTQVVDAILGNPLTKKGGVADNLKHLEDKIKHLENKIVEHEDFRKKVYWGAAFIGFLVIVGEFLIKIYLSLK
jgi:uncharacterized coiled-coil protein SlyX